MFVVARRLITDHVFHRFSGVVEEHVLVGYLNEALKGVQSLTILLTTIGVLLVFLAGILSYFLAKQLTGPIISLTKRMRKLGPGSWSVRCTIKSDDEIEQLELVVADMASRLKQLYDHLEEEVKLRTEELA